MFDLEFFPDNPKHPHHFTVIKCLGPEEAEYLESDDDVSTLQS
jgi:hypothetical protein